MEKKKKRRKRFKSEQSANSFAKKVDGTVNDLREIEGAKSNFTVTYEPDSNRKQFHQVDEWPEEYWRD